MNHKLCLLVGVAWLVSFVDAPDVRAGLIINGSFEAPTVAPGNYLDINPGQESADGFTGWKVVSGNIDVVNGTAPLFGENWGSQAAINGSQILDLNGFTEGTISQQFTTTPGQTYTLGFWYANNAVDNSPPYPHTADITLADIGTTNNILASTTITHDTSILSTPDWDFLSLNFVAQGTTTQLTFASTSGLNDPSGGVVLDAVTVNPASANAAPEPTSLTLLGMGGVCFGGLSWLRRRKRAVAI